MDSITLQVNAPTGPLRYRPFVDLSTLTGQSFGQNNDLRVTVRGLTFEEALPGGSVTLLQDGSPLGTLPLTSQTARFTVSGALPGTHNYSAKYSGDANFFAADSNPQQVFVRPGTPVFTATAIAGTGNVRIVVHGLAGHAPGGSITVFDSSGAHSLVAPLASLDDANAYAVATGFAPTARTVTINYSGDGVYDVLNATIPITAEHRRAAGR